MFVPNVTRATRCAFINRHFCNQLKQTHDPETIAKINGLKEQLMIVSKQLKDLGEDPSTCLKMTAVEIKSEAAWKEEVHKAVQDAKTQQLKKIKKVFLGTAGIAGFGLICAAAGGLWVAYEMISSISR